MSIYEQEIDYYFSLLATLDRASDPINRRRIKKEITYSSMRAREIDLVLHTNRIKGYDILRTINEVERVQPVRYLPVKHPRRMGDFRRNTENPDNELNSETETEDEN